MNEPTPICTGCQKHPKDIEEYRDLTIGMKPKPKIDHSFMMREEGTYNPSNGHFLCTACYIDAGMPASDVGQPGWICP